MFTKQSKLSDRTGRKPRRYVNPFEALEGRTLYSIIELGSVTEILEARNEAIELTFNANGSTTVTDNGYVEGTTMGRTFELSGLNSFNTVTLDNAGASASPSISLNAADRVQAMIGKDTVVFENSLFSSKTLVMPTGSNTVSIGGGARGLAGIGNWTVDGGGATALDITDFNQPAADYTITSTSVDWSTGLGVAYKGVKSLQLIGTAGNAVFNIDSTSVPTIVIGSGTGTDTFMVGQGNLTTLHGAVSITGGSGYNAVVVDDHSESFTGTYTLSSDSVSGPQFGGLEYSGIQEFNLLGAAGATHYNALSISASTFTTVTIGNGNLDSIRKNVTVDGKVNVVLDDSLSEAAVTYTITSNSVLAGDFGGLTYSNLQSLTIEGSMARDTFNVDSTSLPLDLEANGDTDQPSTFNIGEGNLNQLQGAVTVNGNSNGSVVTLDDHLSIFSGTYTLGNDTVTRVGFAGLTCFGVSQLTLHGSIGADSFDIDATSVSTIVYGGVARDKFYVGDTQGDLNLLQGAITLYGGLNDNNDVYVESPAVFQRTLIAGNGMHFSLPGFPGLTLFDCSMYGNYSVSA